MSDHLWCDKVSTSPESKHRACSRCRLGWWSEPHGSFGPEPENPCAPNEACEVGKVVHVRAWWAQRRIIPCTVHSSFGKTCMHVTDNADESLRLVDHVDVVEISGAGTQPIRERWESGKSHHPISHLLVRAMCRADTGLEVDIKVGGDGDNGEQMMFLLDIICETLDETTLDILAQDLHDSGWVK